MTVLKQVPKPGQFLTFRLQNQSYGVPISSVREINQLLEITPVPQAAAYMAGVINLRGKIVPVADLKARFGMDRSSHSRETCIIVLETETTQIGVIVDAVSDVVHLHAENIESPPNLGEDEETSYVTGVGKVEQRVIILLDVNILLGKENLAPKLDSLAA